MAISKPVALGLLALLSIGLSSAASARVARYSTAEGKGEGQGEGVAYGSGSGSGSGDGFGSSDTSNTGGRDGISKAHARAGGGGSGDGGSNLGGAAHGSGSGSGTSSSSSRGSGREWLAGGYANAGGAGVPIPWVMGMDLDQVLALAPDMMIVVIMGGTRMRLVVVMAMAEAMGYLVDMAMVKVTDKGMGIVAMDHHPPKIKPHGVGLDQPNLTAHHTTHSFSFCEESH
uniref:Uncharacterized protein n=1 Tax=Setaria italica TaxID=4555 RepID=K4AEP9_SETIT